MQELNLQEIQKASFVVLQKIKEICEKQGLKYFLAYGTMLGAVRHNGYIPWDDDVDVMMPRADYEVFIQYCIDHAEELEPFEIIHWRTNPKYIYPIARLSDKRYWLDYFGARDYKLGVFVDVYPLDAFDYDPSFCKKRKRLVRKMEFGSSEKLPRSKEWVKNVLKFPYYLWCRMFYRNTPKYLRQIDEMAASHAKPEFPYLECAVWYSREWDIPKEWFDELIMHEFNGEPFPIPKHYDDLLKKYYGDYMTPPPEDKRIQHHCYTAYKL